jgi:DNA helicase-2/ATP-dependent DNA helicase PcrA
MLAGLNEDQVRGVTHGAGPLLVLAGAGSGKTRVITHRIAHLILSTGVSASRIVAVTFTNKAAAEMRERVERLLGASALGGWIGTFHALCLRILRRDGERIGLEPGFAIYDTDDQLALVKRILKAEDVVSGTDPPRSFLSRISRAKNALRSPNDLERAARSPEARLRARVYRLYDEALRKANVVDFDDLLVRTLDLFDQHSEVAAGYASRCEHLLVDEYQDTNRPQYLLIRHLTSQHGNICVVGDEDQSIYRFRGAEIRNILEFEADHPGTCTIRLEQNYRSSGTIIGAAGAVIANNVLRKGKTLWTDNPSGEKLELFHAPDDRVEASWVARRVRELERESGYEDMAVLYRTNAQSRQLEEVFRRDKIPYQIVGSVQFYARKEIKDLLAYLQLAANPADDVSFRRVVNTPARGVGEATLRIVEDIARATVLPLMEASAHALEQGLVSSRSAKRLQGFVDFIAALMQRCDDRPVAELLELLIDKIDYEAYLEKAYAGMSAERMENVQSLISAAVEHFEEEGEEASLQSFLDRSALVASADEVGDRPGVTLMTIHCAKGLEFPMVVLVGLEEGIFPHAMASGTVEDIEEERRLCYVAMTRAKRRLLLSHARRRRLQGALIPHPASRFIKEIPAESIHEIGDDEEGFFSDWQVRGASRSYISSGSSAARAARRGAAPRPAAVPQGVARPVPDDGYVVGALVMHPRFGGGTILDREGKGKHLKLTIHFSDYGPKKIVPAYTKLLVETR